ncbi:MAG: cytochrome C [Betaproteobacteria bacterium]
MGAALLLLLTGAVAARSSFDPKAEEKGGFAPVTDAKYQSECGACHFAYLPGMLPARSWDALLTKSNEHFGETLSLDPESLRHIRNFLTTNAADRRDFRGSEVILRRLPDQSTPLRITNLPAFKGYHFTTRPILNVALRLQHKRVARAEPMLGKRV